MRERVHSLSSVPKAVFMSVDTMQELLINKLKDLDSAEKHIVKALPKLATAASTPEVNRSGKKESTILAAMRRDMLFKGQPRLLRTHAGLVANSFEPIIFLLRRSSHLSMQLSHSFGKP
jgi:hypothetical protein